MKIEDLINVVLESLDDDNVKELTSETIYRELDNWTSITSLSLIVGIEEAFGVDVTGDDITVSPTIGKLFDLICERGK